MTLIIYLSIIYKRLHRKKILPPHHDGSVEIFIISTAAFGFFRGKLTFSGLIKSKQKHSMLGTWIRSNSLKPPASWLVAPTGVFFGGCNPPKPPQHLGISPRNPPPQWWGWLRGSSKTGPIPFPYFNGILMGVVWEWGVGPHCLEDWPSKY